MRFRIAPVVVGVDGSEAARGAVQWAAEEAVRHGRRLKIMHALGLPQRFAWSADAASVVREAAELARGWQPTLDVDTALGVGAAGPMLADESRAAPLVVIGCRGPSPLTGMVLGSASSHLAFYATGPVLIVHHAERWAGCGRPLPARGAVVVGVDGSPAADRALGLAFEEAAARRAPLLVLDTSATDLSSELARWHTRFPAVAVDVSARREHAEAALADASHTAIMLVLGARGRDPLPGRRVGRRLVHQAFCPVLIAHADPARPAQADSAHAAPARPGGA
jgi:nucleotide-binding universal stress UspA family protein